MCDFTFWMSLPPSDPIAAYFFYLVDYVVVSATHFNFFLVGTVRPSSYHTSGARAGSFPLVSVPPFLLALKPPPDLPCFLLQNREGSTAPFNLFCVFRKEDVLIGIWRLYFFSPLFPPSSVTFASTMMGLLAEEHKAGKIGSRIPLFPNPLQSSGHFILKLAKVCIFCHCRHPVARGLLQLTPLLQ